jgi:glucosamine-6-phosphate deaminase
MKVVICEDAAAVGRYVGAEAAATLNRVLARPLARARLLLATGASQVHALADLVTRPVDWSRVEGFHLDEYVGLGPDHPGSFRYYLKRRVTDLVPVEMHWIDPASPRSLNELAALHAARPPDLALVGIGENGHLAFNDPPADLSTSEVLLEVELDEVCRRQQVREGWFPDLASVPTKAVTMSVPAILRSRQVLAAVPGEAKAEVVARFLGTAEVSADLPASALRTHNDTTVVLDRASSRLLPEAAQAQASVFSW